mmetsp:Transcript_12978/g.16237  ORF Transcript_12978/g.16237 Transcript_12978/m.16237 type:complete len:81 (+) Transcript_12978:207-449(+)
MRSNNRVLTSNPMLSTHNIPNAGIAANMIELGPCEEKKKIQNKKVKIIEISMNRAKMNIIFFPELGSNALHNTTVFLSAR